MSYSTKEQVKAMFRNLVAPADNAAVADASIEEFIDEADITIDGAITGVYTLPLTALDNPKSLVLLQKISRLLAAAVVDDVLNSYAEGDKKPSYKKDAMELLGRIAPERGKDGKRPAPDMLLPDAEYIGMNVQKDTISLQAVEGRQFSKGVDAW